MPCHSDPTVQAPPAEPGELPSPSIATFHTTTDQIAPADLKTTTARASGGQGGGCIAHRPAYIEGVFEPHYTAGCSGHDEPELNPVSALPGSAKDFAWTVVLPSNGSFFPVDAVGPAFWFGGTVSDPNSLVGQAFEELQFYPNALVSNCTPRGGFVVSSVPGDYTVCSPVWTLTTTGQRPNFHEPATYNAMLTDGSSKAPLVMHAGDAIRVHFFVTAAKDGWHINVQDLTTGHSGTLVLDSKSDGPLMPFYDTLEIGNALKWSAVCGSRMGQPVTADPHPQRHLCGRLASRLVGGRV